MTSAGEAGANSAPNRGDLNLACAWALVDALVRGGVTEACVSPGSRSTSLALAVARHPAVRVHIHLDERSSAFFALGLAKASGAPVAVITTSGTAAAELFPAVVEASQARVPLVLLTADRPSRLRGTGANQTIDQGGLYGRYVVESIEPSLPSRPGDVESWRSTGEFAVRAGLPSRRRPIHVNCPFDEPLTPGLAAAALMASEPGDVSEPEPVPAARAELDRLTAELSGARGLVLIGETPNPPTSTLLLADRLGWPVLAEPISNARTPKFALSAGQALLGADEWLVGHVPQVVLQLGATPTTRASQRLAASAGRLVVVDASHHEPDPERRATLRVHADPDAAASRLLQRSIDPAPEDWRLAWREADRAAREAIDRVIDGLEEPFEPRVARDVASSIPKGGTLFVGNSTPIRDLDLAMTPREGVRVLANRGASGIDGLVSTALGIARAAGPTVALLGDLSFVYDAGPLLWAGRTEVDLAIAVLTNGGGEVFSLLPQRELPEHRELFVTPHGLELSAICAAARVPHERVTRASDLVTALEGGTGRVRVIEVDVDAELGFRRRRELALAVTESLRSR